MRKTKGLKDERVIDRLLQFSEWAKEGKLVKSRMEFEQKCGLSYNYLYNTRYMTKRGVGCEMVAKIHEAFPMLNLVWVITGKGSMITMQPDEGYKAAYEDLKKKVESLKKVIKKM